MNDSLGEIKCPFSGETAFIRKSKTQKLYIWSRTFGVIFLNTPEGQNYILERAVMYNERGELPGEKESESTNSNTSTKNAQQKKEGLQEKITKNKSDEDEKIKNDQPEKNENDKSPWTLL